ncbi:hypothetical protein SCOR_32955 [Sulfidibacter corallicola]|uniref:C2H2-type domain-containing protein n=1 Tax=Sulfidibacter corallicola TaxID=2818388 RepID=A0A8A4THX1_SULCO|nr:hypothetical protein [Sulfidibacter corallicola]QTD49649.1 hypothetical protein J3U87_29045 [Sulfidibacter corallicola]
MDSADPQTLDAQPQNDASGSLRCTTTVPVDLEPLTTAADMATTLNVDPRFRFTLCHVGTNRNGDHFGEDELRQAFSSAIGQKIDLAHSQDIKDIVGAITAADLAGAGEETRIECQGELYTRESALARLVHKLIARRVIRQVSMECDYQTGTCSVCGQSFRAKADYCVHLKKYKGKEYQGKPVFEVLNGVRFCGLGLLSKEGADPNARITQVAHRDADSPKGDTLEDVTEPSQETQIPRAANSPNDDKPKTEQAPKGQDAELRRVQTENQRLKDEKQAVESKVLELTKQVKQLQSEQQAAARRERAASLIAQLETGGIVLDASTKTAELDRLAELDDAAFTAAKTTWDFALSAAAKKGAGAPPNKPTGTAQTSEPGVAKTATADVRPRDVEDRIGGDLQSRLTERFMGAWRARTNQT